MNNPAKVYDFLKKNPNTWFCDDCVENGSGVDRHECNTIGWTLALFPTQFRKTSTICSRGCNNRDKIATQAIKNAN
jgi:hypothetical protein